LTDKQEKKPEEIKFPITFTKCPTCTLRDEIAEAMGGKVKLASKHKGERKVVDSVVQQEKVKGKIRKELKMGISLAQPIMDPGGLSGLSYPVVATAMEVCAECGTVYAVIVNTMVGQPGMPGQQPRKMPGQV